MSDIVLTEAEYHQLSENIMPEPNSGCWLWLGKGRDGYGRTWIRDCLGRGVHRLFYIFHKGPIPAGHVIDHKCRVRCCANPDHLEAVTWRANAIHRSDGPTAVNATKTHCIHGHEFSGSNVIWRFRAGQKVRECRECGRRYSAEWKRQRRKAARLARGEEANISKEK